MLRIERYRSDVEAMLSPRWTHEETGAWNEYGLENLTEFELIGSKETNQCRIIPSTRLGIMNFQLRQKKFSMIE